MPVGRHDPVVLDRVVILYGREVKKLQMTSSQLIR